MKLEFLDEVNEYGDQVIRLFHFDKSEAIQFRDAVQNNLVNQNKSLDLLTLDFIEHMNCKLVLHLSETDEGIITMDNQTFFCDLTVEGYKNIIRLIEPFCIKESKSFVMLYDIDTQIDFLFSPYGS
ncbi:MAG: hypothetical protein IPP64_15210 [Bacteroidetes bacterium]|nr:hypothetical protein [Bacteroidota bacterium]